MAATDPGPYFDDLATGRTLEPAPPITLSEGVAAAYQAICGDPYRLALSAPLSRTVALGRHVVNPALALHVSIGQSTVATRRVIANLFYRNVALARPVELGETLSTLVEIRGLRDTTRKPGKPPRGMALLGIRTVSDRGDEVANYERCALLPCRADDPPPRTDVIPAGAGELDLDAFARLVPNSWDLAPLGPRCEWTPSHEHRDPMCDTVTSAIELARLTQNQAAVHRDHRLGQSGRRLVYGGHTIGLAQASLCRLVPSIAHVVGWHACDHVGPVFEGDVLSFTHQLAAAAPVAQGRLLAFRVTVDAHRDGDDARVLDWTPIVYAA